MSNLKLTVQAPVEVLSPYVRRILVTLGDEQTDEIVPIGPTGYSYITYSRFPITLHYKDWVAESDEQLFLGGQIEDEQPYFTVKGKFFHIGLEIIPSLPYYLFGVEGIDLVDTGMLLSELDTDFARKFLEAANEEEDPLQVAMLLQEQILGYLPEITPVDYIEEALKLIYDAKGNVEISSLTSAVGLSERHFRRQFKRVIGLNPKQYCKIIQFNAVFEAIQTNNEKALYDLALANGYYDHAHFINDFKVHLGKSPRDFLKSEHSFLKSYLGTF